MEETYSIWWFWLTAAVTHGQAMWGLWEVNGSKLIGEEDLNVKHHWTGGEFTTFFPFNILHPEFNTAWKLEVGSREQTGRIPGKLGQGVGEKTVNFWKVCKNPPFLLSFLCSLTLQSPKKSFNGSNENKRSNKEQKLMKLKIGK